MKRRIVLTLCAMSACTINDVTFDGGGPDASDASSDIATQDVVEAATPGFTMTLTPAHLTEDLGDTFTITINVVRTNLPGAIDFTVTAPASLSTTQPAPAVANTTTFDVATKPGTISGDYDVVVTGSIGSVAQQAHLGVHVGSVYVLDGGAFVVPPGITAVTVKVWGAGGGGGCSCNSVNYGPGGPGGFAIATAQTDGGEKFASVIGAAGTACPVNCTGGGGGGYSALTDVDGGVLVVAGGGGGAGTDGVAGGGGGGLVGSSSSFGTCVVSGGTQDAGGTFTSCAAGSNGAKFQGANGQCTGGGAGGSPGGGNGGGTCGGGGGGGGGYFGGASARDNGSSQSGGGGGSGYSALDGGILVTADAGVAAGSSDPDYASPAATPGNGGRIVIRFAKP